MIQPFNIIVEGEADKRFLLQLLDFKFGIKNEERIIVANGWNKLIAADTEEVYLNMMRRNTANSGITLVIFDADDNYNQREKDILSWRKRNGVEFELFLFPDNKGIGDLEVLLESIINAQNRPVMDCWDNYEESLTHIDIPWRNGKLLTTPARKTKIYAYLEVLLDSTKKEKEKIKEKNRDYKNPNHWNLNAKSLNALIDFLKINLSL